MVKKKRKPTAKVFIDSSVLVAAAISSKGTAREILEQGFSKMIAVYISNDVLDETERNLKIKSPKSLSYFNKFRDSFVAKLLNPSKRKILKAMEFIKAKDAPIVAGAVTAKADYLVTYDRKHLLQHKQEIEKNFKVKVVTPDKLTK